MNLAQLKAALRSSKGTYPKPAPLSVRGIRVMVENPKGSLRRGTDKDGKPWVTLMKADYGYLAKGTGSDGEGLDCYIGPDRETADEVYVVHQNDPTTGRYDEDKAMIGYSSPVKAKTAYLAHYNRPGFFRSMTIIPIADFKAMLHKGEPGSIRWKRKQRRDLESAAMFDDEGEKVWRTIGAEAGADGKRHGGTRVEINTATGEIDKGPKALKGKKVDHLQEHESKQKLESGGLKAIPWAHQTVRDQANAIHGGTPPQPKEAYRVPDQRGPNPSSAIAGSQLAGGAPVAIDKEISMARDMGKLVLPPGEDGKLDPHLETSYRDAAARQGLSVGDFREDPRSGLMLADIHPEGHQPKPWQKMPAEPATPTTPDHPMLDKATGKPMELPEIKQPQPEEAGQTPEQEALQPQENQPVPEGAGAAPVPQQAPGQQPPQQQAAPQQPPAAQSAPHQQPFGQWFEQHKAEQSAAGKPVVLSEAAKLHEQHVTDALKRGDHVPPEVTADYGHLSNPAQGQQAEAPQAPQVAAPQETPKEKHARRMKEYMARGMAKEMAWMYANHDERTDEAAALEERKKRVAAPKPEAQPATEPQPAAPIPQREAPTKEVAAPSKNQIRDQIKKVWESHGGGVPHDVAVEIEGLQNAFVFRKGGSYAGEAAAMVGAEGGKEGIGMARSGAVRFTNVAADAGAEDAINHCKERWGRQGEDYYWQLARERAGYGWQDALEHARKSEDPELQFLASLYDTTSNESKPKTGLDPKDITPGQQFAINGIPVQAQDEDGQVVLKDHGDIPEVPVDYLQGPIPIDEGSLRDSGGQLTQKRDLSHLADDILRTHADSEGKQEMKKPVKEGEDLNAPRKGVTKAEAFKNALDWAKQQPKDTPAYLQAFLYEKAKKDPRGTQYKQAYTSTLQDGTKIVGPGNDVFTWNREEQKLEDSITVDVPPEGLVMPAKSVLPPVERDLPDEDFAPQGRTTQAEAPEAQPAAPEAPTEPAAPPVTPKATEAPQQAPEPPQQAPETPQTAPPAPAAKPQPESEESPASRAMMERMRQEQSPPTKQSAPAKIQQGPAEQPAEAPPEPAPQDEASRQAEEDRVAAKMQAKRDATNRRATEAQTGKEPLPPTQEETPQAVEKEQSTEPQKPVSEMTAEEFAKAPNAHAATGIPYRLYHGTRSKFTGKPQPSSAEGWGKGVYLASKPDAPRDEFGSGGRVLEYYADLKNPMHAGSPEYRQILSDLSDQNEQERKDLQSRADGGDDEAYRKLEDFLTFDPSETEGGKLINDEIRRRGYDGIVSDHPEYGKEVVVFNPDALLTPEEAYQKTVGQKPEATQPEATPQPAPQTPESPENIGPRLRAKIQQLQSEAERYGAKLPFGEALDKAKQELLGKKNPHPVKGVDKLREQINLQRKGNATDPERSKKAWNILRSATARSRAQGRTLTASEGRDEHEVVVGPSDGVTKNWLEQALGRKVGQSTDGGYIITPEENAWLGFDPPTMGRTSSETVETLTRRAGKRQVTGQTKVRPEAAPEVPAETPKPVQEPQAPESPAEQPSQDRYKAMQEGNRWVVRDLATDHRSNNPRSTGRGIGPQVVSTHAGGDEARTAADAMNRRPKEQKPAPEPWTPEKVDHALDTIGVDTFVNGPDGKLVGIRKDENGYRIQVGKDSYRDEDGNIIVTPNLNAAKVAARQYMESFAPKPEPMSPLQAMRQATGTPAPTQQAPAEAPQATTQATEPPAPENAPEATAGATKPTYDTAKAHQRIKELTAQGVTRDKAMMQARREQGFDVQSGPGGIPRADEPRQAKEPTPAEPQAEPSPPATPAEEPTVEPQATEQEPVASQPEASESPDKNALEQHRDMYRDAIKQRRDNGEAVPQKWLDALADTEAKLSGKIPEEGIASNEVFGHPSATSNDKYSNLVPIKVRDAESVERRIDKTNSLIDELGKKLGTADAISRGRIKRSSAETRKAKEYLSSANGGEDQDVLDRLRQETLPELSRLRGLLSKEPVETPVQPPQATPPEPAEQTAPAEPPAAPSALPEGESDKEKWWRDVHGAARDSKFRTVPAAERALAKAEADAKSHADDIQKFKDAAESMTRNGMTERASTYENAAKASEADLAKAREVIESRKRGLDAAKKEGEELAAELDRLKPKSKWNNPELDWDTARPMTDRRRKDIAKTKQGNSSTIGKLRGMKPSAATIPPVPEGSVENPSPSEPEATPAEPPTPEPTPVEARSTPRIGTPERGEMEYQRERWEANVGGAEAEHKNAVAYLDSLKSQAKKYRGKDDRQRLSREIEAAKSKVQERKETLDKLHEMQKPFREQWEKARAEDDAEGKTPEATEQVRRDDEVAPAPSEPPTPVEALKQKMTAKNDALKEKIGLTPKKDAGNSADERIARQYDPKATTPFPNMPDVDKPVIPPPPLAPPARPHEQTFDQFRQQRIAELKGEEDKAQQAAGSGTTDRTSAWQFIQDRRKQRNALENQDQTAIAALRDRHRRHIENAADVQGEDVKPEVLAEYPDLQRQFGKNPEPAAENGSGATPADTLPTATGAVATSPDEPAAVGNPDLPPHVDPHELNRMDRQISKAQSDVDKYGQASLKPNETPGPLATGRDNYGMGKQLDAENNRKTEDFKRLREAESELATLTNRRKEYMAGRTHPNGQKRVAGAVEERAAAKERNQSVVASKGYDTRKVNNDLSMDGKSALPDGRTVSYEMNFDNPDGGYRYVVTDQNGQKSFGAFHPSISTMNSSGDLKNLLSATPVATDGGKDASVAEPARDTPAESKPAPATGEAPVDKLKAKMAAKKIEKAPSLTAHHEFMEKVYSGEVSASDLHKHFQDVKANEKTIKEELEKMTKSDLVKMSNDFHAKGSNKEQLVRQAYRAMLENHHLGTGFSYGMGDYERSLENAISKQTDDQVKEAGQRITANREARHQRLQELIGSVKDPKTLEDFQRKEKYAKDGLASFTPEHRRTYDRLKAEASLTRREQDRAKNATLEQVQAPEGLDISIIDTKHTKTQEPLYVAQPNQRVDRDKYDELNRKAKMLGGWYSSYKVGGAVPGFQFKTKEAAEQFKSLLSGDVDRSKQLEERQAEREGGAVARMRENAAAMRARSEEELNRDRQTNTARRAAMADGVEGRARQGVARANTLDSIAEKIDKGEAKFLRGVRAGTHVEELDRLLNRSKWSRIQDTMKDAPFQERQNAEDATPSEADIEHTQYPYPSLWSDELQKHAKAIEDIPGLKLIAKQLMAKAKDSGPKFRTSGNTFKFNGGQLIDPKTMGIHTHGSSEGKMVRVHASYDWRISDKAGGGTGPFYTADAGKSFARDPKTAVAAASNKGSLDLVDPPQNELLRITDPRDIETLTEAARRMKRNPNRDIQAMGERLRDRAEQYSRLQAMDIRTPEELREALREYLPIRHQPANQDPAKKLERELIGRKIPGFFPTPRPVIDRMLDEANIEPGMKVLEPSAGKGDILDAIRERIPDADTEAVEPVDSLRKLIEAKGHKLAGHDALSHEGEYDRIVMNPPWGKEFGQVHEAEHLHKAYDLLKPGGRLVAIVPMGTEGGKYRELHEWLESVNAAIEPLPAGSFTGTDAFRQTGVNVRMLVIDKPEKTEGSAYDDSRHELAVA